MTAEKPDHPVPNTRGTSGEHRIGQQAETARKEPIGEQAPQLMEEVLCRENVLAAYDRVKRNRGASGIDGVTVEELALYCREHWARIREEILSGRYQPQPVRKVEIPKPGGGQRMLGIPTVVDRLIQQALLQVLTPILDPTFSEWSFGFRPGRRAQDAVEAARAHVGAGYRWVVDLDLERFFDQVNHDVLMDRLARRIGDKRVLLLVRRFLQSGIMEGGVVSPRTEGTPQGGPLSPLLSNLMLDDLDRELETRGHRFVRYADDCNIYVRSKVAGDRVLDSVERFLAKRLRLRVNREKSAVDRPWKRQFLGYTISHGRKPRLWLSPKARTRLKTKLRPLFRYARGRSIEETVLALNRVLRGWMAYYRKVEAPHPLKVLSGWIRRKLRCVIWRHWKTKRTRYARLVALGCPTRSAYFLAYSNHGPWHCSGSDAMNQAFPISYFEQLGLIDLPQELRRLLRAR